MIYLIIYIVGYLAIAIGFKEPIAALIWPIPVAAWILIPVVKWIIEQWRLLVP